MSTYYYVIVPDGSVQNPSICTADDTRSFDRYRLYDDKYINERDWPRNMTFYMSEGILPDYIIGDLAYRPISNQLRTAIETCNLSSTQFLPVQIIHPDFQHPLEYWIMNVFKTVEALDWAKTVWKRSDQVKTHKHPMLNIWKPTFNIKAVKGIDIFHMRVKGDIDPTIYISERVKQSIQNSGVMIGLEFRSVEAM